MKPSDNPYGNPSKEYLERYKRDDQRAKEAFIEYYTKKRKELNNQVIKLWRQIEDIKSLPVTAYESHT